MEMHELREKYSHIIGAFNSVDDGEKLDVLLETMLVNADIIDTLMSTQREILEREAQRD